MQKHETISLIQSLGFQPEGSKDIFIREYKKHDYTISIDFKKNKIIYPEPIQIGDETTCNFSHPENLVVLECVDRLLKKGYRPKDLHLEKKWSLGRTQKSGKADITIKGQDGNTILIIECKTWGLEYEKEKSRMQTSGGQLFSYLQQDRNAKYLCLYSSALSEQGVGYENAIVRIEDDDKLREQFEKGNEDIRLYEKAKTVEELHQVWKENYSCYFHPNGIFEEDVQPYEIDLKPLKIKDLKQLKEGDGSFIHNQFAEILRHNNISDKENAFNKMISLFLCKVVDESKESNEVVDFQWREGIDNYEDLQDRLQKLYKVGMREYLKEEIIYFENDYVEKAFRYHKKAIAKDKMTAMLKALKFYTNNEFAFKEVHNEKLFEQNAKVVNEVVQLIQPYRIKYSQKQQFLGNLFELLLNDGLKQSEGQFFTPVPITRFIVSSLPIHEWVQNRWQKGEVHLLPKVVDYACGSGHFLTEAIDEIQGVIENLGMSQHRGDTRWARDYIFGIEKDYRLARISKIACFLNGAGDANIIYGDGLEGREELGEPESFDILIANPPYSIKDFKQHLHLKHNSFDLLQYLSESASEIETLFVERIHQLLKPGGMAGIILPSSILSNSGIYTRAREVILKYFHIRAIVELGGQTFIATNTNTVILFLQKHINGDSQHFAYRADAIYDEMQLDDAEYHDSNLLHGYCRQIGVEYDDYVSLIRRTPTDALRRSDFFAAYNKWFDGLTEINNLRNQTAFQKKDEKEQQLELNRLFLDKLLAREKEKFYYFCLAFGQQVVIVKAGDKDKEKAFLGYEWSKRRGFEGMKVIGTGKLYDANDFNNPEKCNSYVRQAFVDAFCHSRENGNPESKKKLDSGLRTAGMTEVSTSIHESVAGHVSTARLIDMMDFSRIEFDKQIGLSLRKKIEIESKWPLVRLDTITDILNGGTPKSSVKKYWDGGINWATLIDTKNKYLYRTARTISAEGLKNSNAQLLPVGAVLFSSRATIGDVCIAMVETATNQGYKNFVCHEDKLINEYLYYILKREAKNIETLSPGMTYPEISKTQIADYKIPLPPFDIQKKIVAEIEAVEKQAEKERQAIDGVMSELNDLVNSFGMTLRINDVCALSDKKVEPGRKPDDDFAYIGLEHIESNNGTLREKAIVKGATLRSSKNSFTKGNLLYGKLRPYLNKVYLAEFDGVCSTDILVLKPNNGIILKHILLNKTFVEKASSLMKGTSLPRIGVKDFMNSTLKYTEQKSLADVAKKLLNYEQRISELKSQISAAESKKMAILDKYLK